MVSVLQDWSSCFCCVLHGGWSWSKGRGGQLWAQEDIRQPVCSCVGLCFHFFGCLAWVIPALEPIGCWVGPGLGKKMVASRRAHANEYSPELLLRVSLSPQVPLPTTTFTGDPPIAAGRSGPGSCEVTAFYPGSWGTWGLVCTLQEWSFCLPQSCGVPVIKPTGHQSQMLSGLLFPTPDPQAVEPDMGLRSFTSVGEPLH